MWAAFASCPAGRRGLSRERSVTALTNCATITTGIDEVDDEE